MVFPSVAVMGFSVQSSSSCCRGLVQLWRYSCILVSCRRRSFSFDTYAIDIIFSVETIGMEGPTGSHYSKDLEDGFKKILNLNLISPL